MITADTITDEQIRDLREEVFGTFEQLDCDVALDHWWPKTVRERARARCAEILNARIGH